MSIDPIDDAGHRARCGYRCGDQAATRDSENPLPRYAYCTSPAVATASRHEQARTARPPCTGPGRRRQRLRVCWTADSSKHDHILRPHGGCRGSLRPRSPGCRLAGEAAISSLTADALLQIVRPGARSSFFSTVICPTGTTWMHPQPSPILGARNYGPAARTRGRFTESRLGVLRGGSAEPFALG